MARSGFDVGSIAALLRQTEANLAVLKRPVDDEPRPFTSLVGAGREAQEPLARQPTPPPATPQVQPQPPAGAGPWAPSCGVQEPMATPMAGYPAPPRAPRGGLGIGIELETQVLQMRGSLEGLERRLEEELRVFLGVCEKRLQAKEDQLRNLGDTLRATADSVGEDLARKVDSRLRDLDRAGNDRGERALDEVWESVRRLQTDARSFDSRLSRCALSEELAERFREADRAQQLRLEEKLETFERRHADHRAQYESSTEAWREGLSQRCLALEERIWKEPAERSDIAEVVLKRLHEAAPLRELQEELRSHSYAAEVQQRRLATCEAKLSKFPALEAKVEFVESQTAQQVEEQAQAARGLGDVHQHLAQKVSGMESSCQRLEGQWNALQARIRSQMDEDRQHVDRDFEALQARLLQRVDDTETRLQRSAARVEREMAQQLAAVTAKSGEDSATLMEQLNDRLTDLDSREGMLAQSMQRKLEEASSRLEVDIVSLKREVAQQLAALATAAGKEKEELSEMQLALSADTQLEGLASELRAEMKRGFEANMEAFGVLKQNVEERVCELEAVVESTTEQVRQNREADFLNSETLSVEAAQRRTAHIAQTEWPTVLDGQLKVLDERQKVSEAARSAEVSATTARVDSLESRIDARISEAHVAAVRAQATCDGIKDDLVGLEGLRSSVRGLEANLSTLQGSVTGMRETMIVSAGVAAGGSDDGEKRAFQQLEVQELLAVSEAKVLDQVGKLMGELRLDLAEQRVQSSKQAIAGASESAAAEVRVSALQEALQTLRGEITALHASVQAQGTTAQVATPQENASEVAALQQELQTLRGEITALHASVQAQGTTAQAATPQENASEVAALQQELQTLRGEIAALQASVQAQGTTAQVATSQENASEVVALQEALETLRGEIAALQASVQAQGTTAQVATPQENASEVVALQEALETLRGEITTLHASVQAQGITAHAAAPQENAGEGSESLRADFALVREELQETTLHVATQSTRLQALIEEHGELAGRLASLELAAHSSRPTTPTSASAAAAVRQEVPAARNVAALESRLKRLEDQGASATADLEREVHRYAEAVAEIEAQVKEAVSLSPGRKQAGFEDDLRRVESELDVRLCQNEDKLRRLQDHVRQLEDEAAAAAARRVSSGTAPQDVISEIITSSPSLATLEARLSRIEDQVSVVEMDEGDLEGSGLAPEVQAALARSSRIPPSVVVLTLSWAGDLLQQPVEAEQSLINASLRSGENASPGLASALRGAITSALRTGPAAGADTSTDVVHTGFREPSADRALHGAVCWLAAPDTKAAEAELRRQLSDPASVLRKLLPGLVAEESSAIVEQRASIVAAARVAAERSVSIRLDDLEQSHKLFAEDLGQVERRVNTVERLALSANLGSPEPSGSFGGAVTGFGDVSEVQENILASSQVCSIRGRQPSPRSPHTEDSSQDFVDFVDSSAEVEATPHRPGRRRSEKTGTRMADATAHAERRQGERADKAAERESTAAAQACREAGKQAGEALGTLDAFFQPRGLQAATAAEAVAREREERERSSGLERAAAEEVERAKRAAEEDRLRQRSEPPPPPVGVVVQDGRRRPRATGPAVTVPVARASHRSKEEEIRKAFSEIDVHRRGHLSFDDLGSYLGDYLGFGQAEIHEFVGRHGAGPSSSISFEQFKAGYASLNPYNILHRREELVIRKPGSLRGEMLMLDTLEDCEVYACDTTAQVAVDNCKRCLVLLGPCVSSVMVRDCQECIFWISTQQLRVDKCERCTFHLFAKTEPCIESSEELAFAPLAARYPRSTSHFAEAHFEPRQNLWNAIYDFSGKSDKSHWSILPLDEIVEVTVELDEAPDAACPPESPLTAVTQALLCAEPLASGESCGENIAAIPQMRPRPPPEPATGSSGPRTFLIRDERPTRQLGTQHFAAFLGIRPGGSAKTQTPAASTTLGPASAEVIAGPTREAGIGPTTEPVNTGTVAEGRRGPVGDIDVDDGFLEHASDIVGSDSDETPLAGSNSAPVVAQAEATAIPSAALQASPGSIARTGGEAPRITGTMEVSDEESSDEGDERSAPPTAALAQPRQERPQVLSTTAAAPAAINTQMSPQRRRELVGEDSSDDEDPDGPSTMNLQSMSMHTVPSRQSPANASMTLAAEAAVRVSRQRRLDLVGEDSSGDDEDDVTAPSSTAGLLPASENKGPSRQSPVSGTIAPSVRDALSDFAGAHGMQRSTAVVAGRKSPSGSIAPHVRDALSDFAGSYGMNKAKSPSGSEASASAGGLRSPAGVGIGGGGGRPAGGGGGVEYDEEVRAGSPSNSWDSLASPAKSPASRGHLPASPASVAAAPASPVAAPGGSAAPAPVGSSGAGVSSQISGGGGGERPKSPREAISLGSGGGSGSEDDDDDFDGEDLPGL